MSGRAPRVPGKRSGSSLEGSYWFVSASGILRAPWRVSLFLAAMVIAGILVSSILSFFTDGSQLQTLSSVGLSAWTMLAASWVACWFVFYMLEGGNAEGLAIHKSSWNPMSLVAGFGIGLLAILAIVALLLVTSGSTVSSLQDSSSFSQWFSYSLRLLWVLVPAALWEEIVFRGYLWRVAEDAGGRGRALIFTSLAFAGLHLLNPGAGISSFGAVFLAGLCLGLVRIITSSVGVAWTVHLAWNWGLAGIAHSPVSGLRFDAPGWALKPHGPAWWSGGEWGPEGGLASIMVLAMAFATGLYFMRGQDNNRRYKSHYDSELE